MFTWRVALPALRRVRRAGTRATMDGALRSSSDRAAAIFYRSLTPLETLSPRIPYFAVSPVYNWIRVPAGKIRSANVPTAHD